MRFLNASSRKLELLHRCPPRYAIVSHRWGSKSEEVLFTDIGDEAKARIKGKGYNKILGSCARATQDGLNYVWLDTCCIDSSSSSELNEAINFMYKLYEQSEVCYAYLHDVSDRSEFSKTDWFSRGWTLQELIAPKILKFFTKDWIFIGTREDLVDPIAEVTGISPDILRSGKIPPDTTISQRMSWAANRETTVAEDMVYSLLGILRVHMTPIYGIGDAAFEELQHKLIMKYSDQTLFAWYHTTMQPEDVEMVDGIPAPHSTSNPAAEPGEGDTSIPSYTTTGLFAFSPHQYLASYEISESEFRKNYVDEIREYDYRSYFSVTNNSVRISLPIKQLAGKLYKAVLRCSFEPPDGDEPQRPLFIYLEQAEPWKFFRVHLAPGEAEQEGDEEANGIKGVPGSLERLSDAESRLEGYTLQDINIVGRHGEGSSDAQPRQPLSDPDALPELSESERIAQLPRHPLGVKTTNIIVCGEPGVAAGRVINLIIGDVIIKPLTDYDRETMAVTVIDTTLQSRNIRIFYIIGPRNPFLDFDTYNTALPHMYELVQLVKNAGGIHLVLLCMVGNRVTRTVENNYRVFCSFVCRKQVPTILIVTGLGKTRRMEDWWDKHKTDEEIQAMGLLNHACITVLQGEDEVHERKYKDSVELVQKMLIDFMEGLETEPNVYCPEDTQRWFAVMGRRTMELLVPGQRRSLDQEAIVKTLKERIQLDEAEAAGLAEQFFDEHAMEF